MYRTYNCGVLRSSHIGEEVILAGWVQKHRDKGFIVWVDLRDCYGITQIIFDKDRSDEKLLKSVTKLGREFVIQVVGKVIKRESKNRMIPTGDIEVLASRLKILSPSITPPFTITDQTDGGEDLRMKYRYLDLRRNPIREGLLLRHRVAFEVRNYLSQLDFVEVETPYLIKSTPEGARDFVVPSRMNPKEFYALPQSPQTFKQLLMVGGLDKYFQIVRCFRDEDLRSDRQPEFTQIDCEMSFVEQEDVLQTFEGMIIHLISKIKGVKIDKIPRITYQDAIKTYGTDKPDIRFGMTFVELNDLTKGKGFKVFDNQELIVGINVVGGASFSRKEIDSLVDFVKQPQIGANGLIWMRHGKDDSFKSSVDKFYTQDDLKRWGKKANTQSGDLLLLVAGEAQKTRKQLGELRLHIAEIQKLRNPNEFAPLWVIDFPLLEWNEEQQRYHAVHHPFTSPKPEDVPLLDKFPNEARADAYDIVLNGNEIGGGSIRIFDKTLQKKMFSLIGFSEAQAQSQFGFLMDAFQYGAPPHGGIAFGLDRLVAILGGREVIRDFIAFPKNNIGRDVMIDAPSAIKDAQLEELSIQLKKM